MQDKYILGWTARQLGYPRDAYIDLIQSYRVSSCRSFTEYIELHRMYRSRPTTGCSRLRLLECRLKDHQEILGFEMEFFEIINIGAYNSASVIAILDGI